MNPITDEYLQLFAESSRDLDSFGVAKNLLRILLIIGFIILLSLAAHSLSSKMERILTFSQQPIGDSFGLSRRADRKKTVSKDKRKSKQKKTITADKRR